MGIGLGLPGVYVGTRVGLGDGAFVGDLVGLGVGEPFTYVGVNVGEVVGPLLGAALGFGVGETGVYEGASVGSTVGAALGSLLGSGVGDATLVNVTVKLELVMDAALLSVTVVPDIATTVVPAEIPLAAVTVSPIAMLPAAVEFANTVAEFVVVEIEVTTVWAIV